MNGRVKVLALFLCSVASLTSVQSQTPILRAPSDPDLSKQPTLYVVGYAHLDTQWRWEYPQVINEYLPKTMHENFALFEKYPNYIFNFSGANRYRMIKEFSTQKLTWILGKEVGIASEFDEAGLDLAYYSGGTTYGNAVGIVRKG